MIGWNMSPLAIIDIRSVHRFNIVVDRFNNVVTFMMFLKGTILRFIWSFTIKFPTLCDTSTGQNLSAQTACKFLGLWWHNWAFN